MMVFFYLSLLGFYGINEVRKEEKINSKVNYADFNRKIKKYNEAISERGLRKISSTFYVDSWNRKQKTYLLSKHEAMIFASGERKFEFFKIQD